MQSDLHAFHGIQTRGMSLLRSLSFAQTRPLADKARDK